MAKSIRPESRIPTIRIVESTSRRIDPAAVASALGAEPGPEDRRAGGLGPITLFAVREALLSRRQSSGGRPGLEGACLRAKIPLSDQDWTRLEKLASALSSTGFSPSAGQVGSVLLSMALESVTERLVAETQAGSELSKVTMVQELAAKVTSRRP